MCGCRGQDASQLQWLNAASTTLNPQIQRAYGQGEPVNQIHGSYRGVFWEAQPSKTP